MRGVILGLLLVSGPSIAIPQALAQEPSRAECDRAASALQEPIARENQTAAWPLMPLCGRQGAHVIAASLRASRLAQRPIAPAVVAATRLQDASIAAASAEVASDRRASGPARMAAFRILLAQNAPGAAISDREFRARPANSPCVLGMGSGFMYHADSLPPKCRSGYECCTDCAQRQLVIARTSERRR
jgi:hypothetical protein